MADLSKLQYGPTKTVRKYKSFKWVLSGRWNQGSGNSGATRTYMQWDELGIGFDNGAVCYGPDYWTFDSYTLDGTPWAPDERMPPVLLGGTWGTESSKFDASNFVSLVVYFHTTSGEAILPTSIGLYSTSNQNDYQSSTPLHFILSGLNEETNEYEQLIDIGAAAVNKGNTALTTVSSGFTYHYTVNNLNRLVFNNMPLCYRFDGYSTFKVIMSGLSQHTASTPANYVQLSEIGMSWEGNVDKIGYNVVSTALSGTPWGNGNPDKLFDGSIGGGDNDKFDAYNFTAAEVVYTNSVKCIPSAYSFWSCKDGSNFYAIPNVFKFYGFNDNTHTFDHLATIYSTQIDFTASNHMTHVTSWS